MTDPLFTKEQAVKEMQELNNYIRETRKLSAPQASVLLINYLSYLGVNPMVVASDLKEIQKSKENLRRIT
jgi:hypothetical protein